MTDCAKPLTGIEEPSPARPAKRVHFKTWGCQMNEYDTERMRGLLRPLGYQNTDEAGDADLVVFNTCHIREKAAEKVYSELGRLRGQAKQGAKVAVAGCVAQAEGKEITVRAPIVDIVVGPQSLHRLPEMVARAARDEGRQLHTEFEPDAKFDALEGERAAVGPAAFVTIQEGCDKFCTFCVVPYTRGAEVGRPADAVIAETERLAEQGVREVTLLGQNVNAWRGVIDGRDGGLGALCARLAKIDGIERLRFTTSHPADMDEELIEAFGAVPELTPYLHLPVQSGSDRVLKAMNRRHTAESYLRTIEAVRAARPGIAIAGDMIVGFPGETHEAFEDTMQLTRETRYASCFSFKYSRRPGTPGATMRGQVAEEVKTERLHRLQALLDEQRTAFLRAQSGKTLPVLFEAPGRDPGQVRGRNPYLHSVHANGPDRLIGQVVDVRMDRVMTNSFGGSVVVRG